MLTNEQKIQEVCDKLDDNNCYTTAVRSKDGSFTRVTIMLGSKILGKMTVSKLGYGLLYPENLGSFDFRVQIDENSAVITNIRNMTVEKKDHIFI